MKSPHLRVGPSLAALTLALFGCSHADAPKAYGRFNACVVGADASAAPLVRARTLRSLQLARGTVDERASWPGSCNQYADALYAASGDMPLMKSALEKQLGCKEGGGCSLPTDDTLFVALSAVWDAAEGAKLVAEPAPDVVAPKAGPAPLFDAKTWTSLSDKPVKVVGPRLSADGHARFLLVPKERSEGLIGCELPPGAAPGSCFVSNPKLAGVSTQSVQMTRDDRGFYAAGLTVDGMRAFDLRTGESGAVAGMEQNLVSNGLAVEPGTAEDGKAPAPSENAEGAVPSQREEDFVAVVLSGGKAGKGLKLGIKPVGVPRVVAGQVVYITQGESGSKFNSKRVEGGKVKDVATLSGKLIGPMHSCEMGGKAVVATYGFHTKQRDAKPTAGEGGTQVTMLFGSEDGWSKAVEATLPFTREVESDLVCTKTGASLTWARPVQGGAEVGRLDCDVNGCKSSQATLPGLESKWWWAVVPVGDQVLVVWRGAFGETRLRIGTLEQLPKAPDTVVFDNTEQGGPETGEATSIARDTDALLLFRSERPVALRIGADGKPTLMSGH